MYIRQSTKTDLFVFKPSRDDRLEAVAAGIAPGFPPHTECVSLVTDGDIEGTYSLLAIGGNVGDQVWFVTDQRVSRLTREERLEFRKNIIEYRDRLHEKYPILWNYVWVGNRSHIRFLKTIGAVFENDFTLNGTFQLFTIRRQPCAG